MIWRRVGQDVSAKHAIDCSRFRPRVCPLSLQIEIQDCLDAAVAKGADNKILQAFNAPPDAVDPQVVIYVKCYFLIILPPRMIDDARVHVLGCTVAHWAGCVGEG